MKRYLLLILLVPFVIYSVECIALDGYFGFVRVHLASRWGVQVMFDLLIALGLFLSWMIPDARARGIRAWPYVIATLTLGSVGALSYLVHREWRASSATADHPSASIVGA